MPVIEHHQRIIDALERHGAKEVQLVKGHRHPRIEFTYRGRRRKYFVADSPSDWRATSKALADIRRIIKEMNAQK